jgi:ribose transport system ATP-binding protein
MTAEPPPRLVADRVSKTFGPVRVLNAARLMVRPGEVHGLVGENGSGKSTLVKILTGYHAPDPGATLTVDGRPLHLPVRWADAQVAGISVVHQDLGLLDHLTVAENICVGGYQRSRWMRRIDWRHAREIAAELLGRLSLEADPAELAGGLPAGTRAGVAIARALRDHVPGSGLIILDEATRLLVGEDLTRFHRMLRDLAAEGTAVLMVSHNLEEVLAVTDRVTVLRDGQVSGDALATAALTETELARRMLGTTVSAVTPRQPSVRQQAVAVTGLHGDGVAGLSLTLGEGEIVGLTGLPGSGFEAIPYLLAGTRPARDGTVAVGGSLLHLPACDVRSCMRAGIVLVPERRDRDGLAYELTVADNIALPALVRGGRHFVSKRWQRQQGQQAIESMGIRASSPLQLVKQLSGGNQQKVLLAKWLSVKPRLLVLHEPTQAVDVGARADLLRTIHRAADAGTAVLLVSTEPADLIASCDRILLFRPPGELAELRASSPDQVLEAVYGSSAVSQEGE